MALSAPASHLRPDGARASAGGDPATLPGRARQVRLAELGAATPPIVAAMIAFVLYLSELLARADALRITAYDTAFFEQVVWNVGHGRGWSSGYLAANFLGLHFEPALLLPALLERLGAGWEVLLVLEALGLALSGPAAYLFFRALLGDRAHARLTAAALATPLPFWVLVQNAADAAWHTEALALPLVLLAGWLGLRGRWVLCWVAVLAVLLTKEDAAYATLVLGLLLVWHGPSRRQGALLTLVSLAWAVTLEHWVMPHLLAGAHNDLTSYYAWLHHPTWARVLQHLVRPEGWIALAVAVIGMGALPLLRPGWLLLAAPPFLGSLFSAHWPQPALQQQYGLPVVFPLLVAGGLGAGWLLDHWRLPAGAARPVLAALAVPALVAAIVLGPMLGAASDPGPSRAAALSSCSSVVPPDAPVATDDDVAVWFAARPHEVPLTWAKPDEWVIVDRSRQPPGYVDKVERARLLQRLPTSGRTLACSSGGLQVWTPVPAASSS